MFEVTKSYGFERGLTTSFRNWRDTKHCNVFHGYALRFDFTFTGPLDARGWVIDFGALAPLHKWLQENHDHVTYVAADDPQRALIELAAREGLFNLQPALPAVSMEVFAQRAFERAKRVVEYYNTDNIGKFAVVGNVTDIVKDQSWCVHVTSCTVYEHPANAVTYRP